MFAFDGYTALTSVTIASSVTTIGNAAFYECTSLTTINGASGVTDARTNMIFAGTPWLTNLPVGLNYVSHVAYRFVGDGTSVKLDAGTTQIAASCFQNSQITSIDILNTVTSIGEYAFHNSVLTSVIIPASVENIGSFAFAHFALQKIYVLRNESTNPNITNLGNYAFEDCNLAAIVVPAAAYDNYNGDWHSYVDSRLLKRGYTVTCGTDITATTTNEGPLVEQDEEVTLTYTGSATIPTGYCPAYSYNDGSDDHAINGTTFPMPDADVTVSVALRSTGQAVTVSYIDANGDPQTTQAIALDGTETSIGKGWYFVGKDITYTSSVTLNGDVNLILKDGCEMKVGMSESPISGHGISGYDYDNGTGYDLTITSQSLGNDMGRLEIYIHGEDNITANNLTVNGGYIYADNDDDSSGDTLGTVSVKDGQTFVTDYTTPAVIKGTVSDLTAINGKTLSPYGYSLTANEADGNPWTTFYSSQSGFSIETTDAYTYTAEYDGANSQLTLTKLGTDIPAATAVIIVSAISPVTLAINSTLGTFTGTNDLQGVDVRTLKSTLGYKASQRSMSNQINATFSSGLNFLIISSRRRPKKKRTNYEKDSIYETRDAGSEDSAAVHHLQQPRRPDQHPHTRRRNHKRGQRVVEHQEATISLP